MYVCMCRANLWSVNVLAFSFILLALAACKYEFRCGWLVYKAKSLTCVFLCESRKFR